MGGRACLAMGREGPVSLPGVRSMPRRLTIAGFAALLAVMLVAYWPALHAGFIWDDDDYVTHNPTLGSIHGLYRIWFEPGAVPQYYPMVHTTFWIEHHLWGLNPVGYHLVNVCLHFLAVVLLWLLLNRLRIPGAWVACGLFALHPVMVESVAWVTERKNVLSAVFYLSAMLAWFRFRPLDAAAASSSRGLSPRAGHEGPGTNHKSPGTSREDPGGGDLRLYFLALVFFLCALWSKTVAGSLPVAILILLWWKRGRITRRDLLPLVPFVVLAAALGSVTLWMEHGHVGAQGAEWRLSFVQRCLIAGRAVWFYLGKLLWPSGLAFIYPRWTVDPARVGQILYPVAALALAGALWVARSRIGRGPLAAALFFGITLFPALGFFNVYPMRYSFVADHFQYLAALGPFVLGGAIVARAARRITPHGGASSAARREAPAGSGVSRPVALGIAILLLALSVPTRQRAVVLRDPETLWRDTLAKNPGAWMAHHNLGKYYEDQKRIASAIDEYRAALRIRPDLDKSLYNLGNDLASINKVDEAVQCYEQALRANPTLVEAHNNLGNALHMKGLLEPAIEQYREAVTKDSTYAEARRNLAFTLAEAGRVGEAVGQFRIVLRREPGDLQTMNRLAWLLGTAADSSVRRPQEAVLLAEAACRRTGYGNPVFLATLAAAWAADGRFERADTTVTRAIRIASSAGRADMAAQLEGQREMYKSHRCAFSPGR
jgi:tetratricopeptide (TPR) repeat protein